MKPKKIEEIMLMDEDELEDYGDFLWSEYRKVKSVTDYRYLIKKEERGKE